MRVPSESQRMSEGEPFFDGLSRAEAMEALHDTPDWESLMEAGVLPTLLLGEERRLQRKTEPRR
jgi:hypothetical protein